MHDNTHVNNLIRSLALIEHLLNDLVNTTNSYKILQDRESKLVADLSLAQSQLFPLRKDNARLARENHELHVENIRQNDALISSTEDHR